MMKKPNILKINQLEKMALIINELCIIEKNISIRFGNINNSSYFCIVRFLITTKTLWCTGQPIKCYEYKSKQPIR